MINKDRLHVLEAQLNDFDFESRKSALKKLLAMAENGDIEIESPKEIANMHCHTFFSYNGYGFSPMAIAWLAKKRGIKFVGVVDFDVLDAVEEFLDACEMAGVYGSAGIETRVFIPEFATREINSPGEPGISYHMGIGFIQKHIDGEGQNILDDMRARAESRTRDMVDRMNAFLAPVTISYEEDVVPLTPNGNATERHLLTAYVDTAARKTQNPVDFWAGKLGSTPDEIALLSQDLPKLKDLIRKKLMKRGGVGYVQPGPMTFPSVDESHSMFFAAGALPCITWLDGTSEGEKDIVELVELLITKGAVAVNIVPDRNWNIADPDGRALKVKNLYELVEIARKYDLPLNVGTEMNAYGLKLVDDFDAEELLPVREDFIRGAYFIYGHTIMARHAGMGYMSSWSQKWLPSRKAKNDFYIEIGQIVTPGKAGTILLSQLSADMSPVDVINHLKQNAVSKN